MKYVKILLCIIILIVFSGCTIDDPVLKDDMYTVEFLVDGKAISTQTVEKGKDAVKPSDPVKDGFEFVGWDQDFSNVTSDLKVNAKFKSIVGEETFNVNFLVDGKVIHTEKVKSGEAASSPLDPTKEGYRFVGWDQDFSNITSDLDVNAKFEKVYLVQFFVKNELYYSIYVIPGEKIEGFEEPSVKGYKFIGWDQDFSNVTANLIVNAKLEEKEIYVVDFIVDGKSIQIQDVYEGESAIAPSDPVKSEYKFIGWDQDFSCVTEDMEINAKFEKIVMYTVNFYCDGNLISSQRVEVNHPATKPIDPEKFEYVFTGWDQDFSNIISDLDVNAIFVLDSDPSKSELYLAAKELDKYFDNLTYPLKNCTIDLVSSVGNVNISWESSNPEIIALGGGVRCPFMQEKTKDVVLTAKLYKGDVAIYKKINVVVNRGYKDLSRGINACYYGGSSLTDLALDTYDIIYANFMYIASNPTGNLKGGLKNIINSYKKKAHEHGVRIVYSLAVQSGDDINTMKKIINNQESFDNLIMNLVNFVVDNDLDGIDMDWETPRSDGAPLYTKLMKRLYEELKSIDKDLLVTAAIGAGPWQYPSFDLQNSARYHDYINMMSYDMQASGTTSFQNALYYKNKGCASDCNINDTLTIYESVGVKRKQIIVGVPFYGRVFRGASSLWSKCDSGTTAVTQGAIASYKPQNGYTKYFDNDAKVPYLVNETNNTFVTYEDQESITYKWQYINEKGLAGMMCWNYSQDYNDNLTKAMKDGKSRYGFN